MAIRFYKVKRTAFGLFFLGYGSTVVETVSELESNIYPFN